jgi:MoxR-like ATPase
MLKSNDGTLNGMLTALNERRYEGQPIPLWTCGAATNWPEVKSRSENVAALWDRMLLRCHVREVEGQAARLQLLEAVDAVARYQPECRLTMRDLAAARDAIRQVVIDGSVRTSLLEVESRLEKQNIKNSSRRMGALQAVLRAKAWLRGDTRVTLDDFDVLELGLWNDAAHIEPLVEILKTVDQQTVQECISAIVEATQKCKACTQVQLMPEAIEHATNTSIGIKEKLAQRGVRQAGRARIGSEIEKLRAAYTHLKSQVLPHLQAK